MVDGNTGNMLSIFSLQKSVTKKGKQIVSFDQQNINSLFSRHHYCVTIELKKHDYTDYKPINAVIFFGLFCKSL